MDVQQVSPPQTTQLPQQSMPTPTQAVPPTIPTMPTAPQPRKDSTVFWWVCGIVIMLVCVVAGIYFFSSKNQIVIEDQMPGRSIFVKRLTLKTPAFLVVNRISAELGSEFLVATRYLRPEEYFGFTITIRADEINDLAPGEQLRAVLYTEDVNRSELYEEDVDSGIIRDIFGRPVQANFHVR